MEHCLQNVQDSHQIVSSLDTLYYLITYFICMAIIKKITRFAAIGFAGSLTWMIASPEENVAFKYPRTTLPPYMTPTDGPGHLGDPVFAITVTLSVVIAGLAIERILSVLRK